MTRIVQSQSVRGKSVVHFDADFVYVRFADAPTIDRRFFIQDCPAYLVEYGKRHQTGTVELGISCNGEFTKIYNAKPTKGTHAMRIKEFSHEQNKPPMPRIQQGGIKNGAKLPDQVVFDVILEIIYGDFSGFEIGYRVPYAFHPDQFDPTQVQISGTGMRKCGDFCEKFGLTAETVIPMSDNILPWLETFFKKEGKVVHGEIGDSGYIDQLSYPPEGMTYPTTPAPVMETQVAVSAMPSTPQPAKAKTIIDEQAYKILETLGTDMSQFEIRK